METLAERLDSAMTRKRLSNQALSDRLGNNPGREGVRAWRKGATSPTVEDVRRIAGALEVSSQWLMIGEEPTSASEAQLSPAESRAIEIVRALGLSTEEVIRRLSTPPQALE